MEIILYCIGYLIIAVLFMFISDIFNTSKFFTDDDICFIGVMWPLTLAIIILIVIPLAICDFLKEKFLIFFNRFSKKVKNQRKLDSRKIVEDILSEITK